MDVSMEEDSSQNSSDFGARKVCSGALPESLGTADGRLFFCFLKLYNVHCTSQLHIHACSRWRETFNL